jgi:hypothetical protein
MLNGPAGRTQAAKWLADAALHSPARSARVIIVTAVIVIIVMVAMTNIDAVRTNMDVDG